MIVRWKIWYDNGTTFDSKQGPPETVVESAPLDGVIAIAEEDDTGRKQTYWGADFYYWTGDGWAAGNQADLERWLRGFAPRVKYGRWTQQTRFQKIRALVKHEWF